MGCPWSACCGRNAQADVFAAPPAATATATAAATATATGTAATATATVTTTAPTQPYVSTKHGEAANGYPAAGKGRVAGGGDEESDDDTDEFFDAVDEFLSEEQMDAFLQEQREEWQRWQQQEEQEQRLGDPALSDAPGPGVIARATRAWQVILRESDPEDLDIEHVLGASAVIVEIYTSLGWSFRLAKTDLVGNIGKLRTAAHKHEVQASEHHRRTSSNSTNNSNGNSNGRAPPRSENGDGTDRSSGTESGGIRSLLQLLQYEVAQGYNLKDPSGAVGAIWIGRTAAFVGNTLDLLANYPNATLKQCLTQAYKEQLERFHKWLTSASFQSGASLCISREEFMKALSEGTTHEHVLQGLSPLAAVLMRVSEKLRHVVDVAGATDDRRV